MTKKIIIDTDPGIDDAIAIQLALSIKEYDLLGITLVSGNVHADLGLINLFRIAKQLQTTFPIYQGTKAPLEKTLIEAKETHGDDGLGNTYFPYDPYEYSSDGVTFILDSLRTYKDVTIFALGPLTNIATALKIDATAFSNARVIAMGGAFHSYGNCSPVAEYNFWVDPHAADYVLKHLPHPLEIIPLDVTRSFLFTPALVAQMQQLNKEKGDWIKKITNFYMDFHWRYEKIIGAVINDPVTIIAERHPEYFQSNLYFCEVETHPSAKSQGMLIVDSQHFYKKKPNALLYETLDEEKAMDFFLRTLFPQQEQSRRKEEKVLL